MGKNRQDIGQIQGIGCRSIFPNGAFKTMIPWDWLPNGFARAEIQGIGKIQGISQITR